MNNNLQTLRLSEMWWPSGGITSVVLPTTTTNLQYLLLGNSLITSINVSAYTNLIHLYVGGNPLMSSINITGLSSLTILRASGTFNTIDLSTNVALQYVQISSPNLTALNTSNNPAIYYLNTNAFFGGTPITSLDLSNNPLLTDLILTQNTAITTLNISVTPLLENLILDGCSSLNTLTVGANTALTNVNITSVDGVMSSLFASIYSLRGVMPNSSVLFMGGTNTAPTAPELVQINDLTTNYFWSVTHN